MVRVITVKPKDMSDETIKARLDGLRQEIKDNESEIKELEDELERRKQELPLGVPVETESNPEKRLYYLNLSCFLVDGCNYIDKESPFFKNLCLFHSKESAQKHAEMLLAWRMALVANSKGEPIDIKVLLPLLRRGWVSMDKNGDWYWYSEKPVMKNNGWVSAGSFDYYDKKYHCDRIGGFNLKPAENWEDSLMECGL